ncbi:MAG: tetratricopeptide repeat protein [Acidobacteria bacterium]|nr:tetratricopeptide repeat protein [Acidobacteriota bacterium]
MSLNKLEALRQAELYVTQGNMTSAINLYRRVIETDPFDLSAINGLGDLYIKNNRPQEAANHYFKTAEGYLKKGSTNSAIYLLTKILKFDPLNAQVYMTMGDLYARDGVTQKAHDCFIEAGAAFWQNHNLKAALAANEKALKVDANSRQAKAALQALREEAKPQEPEVQPLRLTKALAPIFISFPDDAKAEAAPSSAATLLATESAADEAEDLLSPQESILALDEETIVEYISAAEMLIAYGRMEEALAKLRELLKRKPDDVQIRNKLKDIYLRGERIERAAEECINIAGIYLASGDSGRARDYLIRAELLERALGHITSES